MISFILIHFYKNCLLRLFRRPLSFLLLWRHFFFFESKELLSFFLLLSERIPIEFFEEFLFCYIQSAKLLGSSKNSHHQFFHKMTQCSPSLKVKNPYELITSSPTSLKDPNRTPKSCQLRQFYKNNSQRPLKHQMLLKNASLCYI